MEHAGLVVSLLIEYRYWIVIPLAFIEGPIVGLNVGFLASLGFFNPFVMLIVLLVRDFLVDACCYALGRFGNGGQFLKRAAARIGVADEDWRRLESQWETHPGRTMFFSKIAYGVSSLFLISAGMSGIPYRRFWKCAIEVSVFQYCALIFFGYYFGRSSYHLLSHVLSGIELASLGILALSVAFYFFSRFMRSRLVEEDGL